ncbi:methyltransferase [Candidatus Woesearchaeota archaeon]|nr:methyltransferase [Candidatus Woesearchaeota archaeon]
MAEKKTAKKMAENEVFGKHGIGSKKALAVILSKFEVFKEPKVSSEQYATDAEIAAEVLWNVYMANDIGKVSADLGCGTGILGIGMLLLGARKVFFVDYDSKALEIAKNNLEKAKSESSIAGKAIFICESIKSFNEKVDLVVQNPPFGVKIRHMDKMFLEKAFEISNVIYSFHKSESKGFIDKFSRGNGFKVTNVWEFEFPLKATLAYHTKKIKRIKVSCFRIEKS